MKTIYVIGAGFSVAAGFPLQNELLEKCLQLRESQILQVAGFAQGSAKKAQDQMQGFINDIFPKVKTPRLEDIFTTLDLAISKRQYIKNYDWLTLFQIRESLIRLIIIALYFSLKIQINKRNDFYEKVATYFIHERLKAGIKADTYSIIQLNWDSLIEEKVYSCIEELDIKQSVDIDYCCYSTPLSDSYHTPSLTQKAKRIFNIKVQKLHGSINWLRCPNCDRLFTGLGSNLPPGELYIRDQACSKCSKTTNTTSKQTDYLLEQYLVSPTYAKVFDNTHVQMIWHNAYVDLIEASKIIFLGYSLPEADYHIRALLSRSVNPNAEIVVVLSNIDKAHAQHSRTGATERYIQFFGADRVNFHYEGVENYFENDLKIGSLKSKRRSIKQRITHHRKKYSIADK